MGSLYLYDEDFELANIPEEQRNDVVADFFKMKSNAREDKFYASDALIYIKPFSFGVGLNALMLAPWRDLNRIPSCAGIKEITYALFSRVQWSEPVFRTGYTYKQLDEPKAYAKFREEGDAPTFVSCKETWKEWHAQWYRAHQDQIPWVDGKSNDILPFVEYALDIMKAELLALKESYFKEQERLNDKTLYDKEIKGIDLYLSNEQKEHFTVVEGFYAIIMAHKGSERYAYAETIGKQVLEINGYIFEDELTQREQEVAKSLRSVFSIIGKDGHKQYVSIDFEHGMFEFINHLNVHLGEFRFDGTYNSGPEQDHAFKTLR